MNIPSTPPQWRKITKEDPPQFPCWLWSPPYGSQPGHWWRCTSYLVFSADNDEDDSATHWHPDSPTAPEGRPEETNLLPESGASRSVQTVIDRQDMKDSAAFTGKARVAISPQESPAETATTETDYNEMIFTQGKFFPKELLRYVKPDFARRLERERDQARAQLQAMTDQFLAVSGELGEAKELLVRAAGELELATQIYPRANLHNTAPLVARLAADIRSHLAQSDSPGAGVKGEGSP